MGKSGDDDSIIAMGSADPSPDGSVLLFATGLVDVGHSFPQVESRVRFVVHSLDLQKRLVLVLVHFRSKREKRHEGIYLRKPRNTDFTQRRTGALVFFGVTFFVIKIINQLY